MLSDESTHKKWAKREINNCLDRHEYSPIIFAGTGISRRYIDAPNWKNLLAHLADICPKIEFPIDYYEEEYELPEIATQFIDSYRDWAWEDRGTFDHFDPEIYYQEGGKEKYLKHKLSEYILDISPDNKEDLPDDYEGEIEALRRVSPNAIITTNYDLLLEKIFPGFETMIGQEIYLNENKIVGDLFKIHGCASKRESLVLTKQDYDKFRENKKYISAKLLTYFTEHPVLIVGYSASDENIKSILSDLANMVPSKNDNLLKNIFIVDYEDDEEKLTGDPDLPRQKIIDVGENGQVRVNSITANSFEWIFREFAQDSPMEEVQIQQVREFTSKIYDITTKDAPRKKINFERLEYFSGEENIEKLLGFVPIDNPETVGALEEAGIPVGEREVSTKQVTEINARLNTATQNYASNGTLIDSRSTILEFRNRIDDLELDNKKCKLLIRSSLNNGLQGGDWLIKYDGDVTEVLENMINEDDVNARVIPRVAYTLLVLGEKEMLKELYNKHSDNGFLKKNYIKNCDDPIKDRVKIYSAGSNITSLEERVSVESLIGDETRTEEMLEKCSKIIIGREEAGEDMENAPTDFRRLELVKIANNLDEIVD